MSTKKGKEKISCVKCGKMIINILLHLKRSVPCRNNYDIEAIEKEQNEVSKMKQNGYMRKSRAKQRKENEELYKEEEILRKKTNRAKKRTEDNELFKEEENLRKKTNRAKQRTEDNKLFKEKVSDNKRRDSL